MILLINNMPVAVKRDASIEYNSVNCLFGDREDYTLNIELPLNNKANMAVFGRLDRLDAEIKDVYMDAEIIDGAWHKSGAVAVTSVTDTMVKVQFIADRSFQNFYPDFDKKYVDELRLPAIPCWLPDNLDEQCNGYSDNRNTRPGTRPGATDRGGDEDEQPATVEYKSTDQAWGTGDIVALPWVNAASGNIQNRADYGRRNGSDRYYWHVAAEDEYDSEAVRQLSCQIRLHTLTSYICDALGYSLSAQEWIDSDYYHLYSFNCLPAAWKSMRWQDTLPHWSINEFFENLEKLMLCDIRIDHKNKSVSFSWQEPSNGEQVVVEHVIEEHTATVTKDDQSEYRPVRNIGYADGGHNMSPLYSCPWYFQKYNPRVMELESMQAIVDWFAAQDGDFYLGYPCDIIFYAGLEDMYFVLFVTQRLLVNPRKSTEYARYGNVYRLIPLNAFGTRIIDKENWEEAEEIGIIPAWIDDTDKGMLPFFDAGTTGEGTVYDDEVYRQWNGQVGANPNREYVDPDQIIQPYVYKRIRKGDSKGTARFSHLQVAFWYGMGARTWGNEGDLPRPFLTDKEFVTVWSKSGSGNNIDFQQRQVVLNPGSGSLRLNTTSYGLGARMDEWISIDSNKKYEISFLSDVLPDVKSVFIIHGKKYLCSLIKTEITADGMSQLKKGTFYRIL